MQKKRHKGQQKCPIELMSHFVRSHELAKYLQERKTTMTSTALCIYGLRSRSIICSKSFDSVSING